MNKISKISNIFTMSKNNLPVVTIDPGETIVLETYDCFSEQIQNNNDTINTINMELSNPATGPIYINGTNPGDILKVEIKDIKLAHKGCMTSIPKVGILGDFLENSSSKIIPIENDEAIFNEKLHLPINPMIGVIGVAPKNEDIQTVVPNIHGGNLDCKKITKGSTIYLPIFTEGALLSIGDLHALMGDGEVLICGLEISGEVTIKVDIIKNKSLPLPMVVDDACIMTLSSKSTIDEAAKDATINMFKFLTDEVRLSKSDASMLLSLVGNVRICQMVDPLMTVRMEFPKSILEKYNYHLE